MRIVEISNMEAEEGWYFKLNPNNERPGFGAANWPLLLTSYGVLLFSGLLYFSVTPNNSLFLADNVITICIHQEISLSMLNIYLNVSTLNINFCMLTSLVFQLCFLWDQNSMNNYDNNNNIIFQTLLITLFLTENLVYFFILFEASLLPIFINIANTSSSNSNTNANYYLALYTLASGFFFIIALLLTFSENKVSTFFEIKLEDLNVNNNIAWLSLLITFLINAPTFPFHIWLPEAHVEATTQGSVILAAVLLNIGAFGLINCNSISNIFCASNLPFISSICFLSIYIALAASAIQLDINSIIAYFSIAHMNILVLGLLINSENSFLGSYILVFSHGFTSAGLFFSVGSLYNSYHSNTILYFSGLWLLTPNFCQSFLFLNMLNAGLPVSSNFIAELLIFSGIVNNSITLGLMISLSIILTISACMLLLLNTIFGTINTEIFTAIVDLPNSERLIISTNIFTTIIIGILPVIH